MAGQQLLEARHSSAIAEFKAKIEQLLATQLANHKAQLLELQQSMLARYDENLASLTQLKADLGGQLEQYLVQIPALTEAVANLQQQVQATKPSASLSTTLESSTTSSREAVPVSKAHKAKVVQQQTTPLVSQPEKTSTASSSATEQPNSKKKAVGQRGKQATPSSVAVDGDSVVINGDT
jgi:hypothetical protein